MTHITCTFPSYALGTMAEFHIILPRKYTVLMNDNSNQSVPAKGYRTLILLHGACDSASDWLLHSRAADLADEYQIALLIPSVGNSFYLDHVNGINAFTYLTSELLDYAREIFPLSTRREDTYICGYSMGGYGAVRAALLRPELFGKVASLSGALDIKLGARYIRTCGYLLPTELQDIKGLSGTDKDILYCMEHLEQPLDNYPTLYLACGEQDLFASSTKAYGEKISAKGLSVTYALSPGGHDWNYWSQAIITAIKWMYE